MKVKSGTFRDEKLILLEKDFFLAKRSSYVLSSRFHSQYSALLYLAFHVLRLPVVLVRPIDGALSRLLLLELRMFVYPLDYPG